MKLLDSENFRWTRCVDIFDGGPSIECDLDRIRTVREMSLRRLTVNASADHIEGAEPLMISSPEGEPFVCALGYGHRKGQSVVLHPEIAERADLNQGANVYAVPMRKGS